jgi:thiol:disulfide interchange protein
MWFAAILTAGLLAPADATDAQGVQFSTGTWVETLRQAQRTNKLVFIDFYTDW